MAKLDRRERWRILHLERLGLKEDPFKSSADPRYLYLGAEHLGAYRQAIGVIERRRGLATLTGEIGMGKSSLARRLFDNYYGDDDIVVHYIDTASFKSQMDAARTISGRFGIKPARSYTEQIERLQQVIFETYDQGKNVAILMDDAQRMDTSALETIHHLYNFDYSEKLVQVILFGQLELHALMHSYPAVDSRIFVRAQLSPIVFSTALDMVNFRLNVAGRATPLFDDDAFALLYEASGGIPRTIVNLCAQVTDLLLDTDQDIVSYELVESIVDTTRV